MKISIHLVVYNGQKYLPFCLDSVRTQRATDWEMLIIDNHSQDDSLRVIEDYLNVPRNQSLRAVTKVVKNSRNQGFAGAHNQALQWCKSDYILMLNQDVILDPHYLERIIAFLDKHPDAAAATGKIFQWDFDKVETRIDEDLPLVQNGCTNKIDSLGIKINRQHRVVELTATHLKNQLSSSEPLEIFGVSGAIPVYRREALEQTKIPIFTNYAKSLVLYEHFDNDFFCYKEDVDLAYRLRLFGWRSFLVPAATAWHDRSASTNRVSGYQNRRERSKFINFYSYRNHLFFLHKNVPGELWLKYGLWIISYELVKAGYLLLAERSTLRVWVDFFKKWLLMEKKRLYIQKKVSHAAGKNILPWLNSKTV